MAVLTLPCPAVALPPVVPRGLTFDDHVLRGLSGIRRMASLSELVAGVDTEMRERWEKKRSKMGAVMAEKDVIRPRRPGGQRGRHS